MKQYEQAIVNFNRAIDINPQYLEAINDRGELYAKLKQYEQAIRDYTRSIELDPRNAHTYFSRADQFLKTVKLNRALGNINRAILLDDKSYEYLTKVYLTKQGEIFRGMGDMEKACQVWQNSSQIGPNPMDWNSFRSRLNC